MFVSKKKINHLKKLSTFAIQIRVRTAELAISTSLRRLAFVNLDTTELIAVFSILQQQQQQKFDIYTF